MALGGGTWITQNKTLPGTYINVVSRKYNGSALGDRGIVAVPGVFARFPEQKMTLITAEKFYHDSFNVFGVDYGDSSLKNLREVFKHARAAYIWNFNGPATGGAATGSGQASLTFTVEENSTNVTKTIATAKYYGSGGNNLKYETLATVTEGENDQGEDIDITTYTVTVKYGDTIVFQKANLAENATFADLGENDWCVWAQPTYAIADYLSENGKDFTGGADVTPNNTNYTEFFKAAESYTFNIMAIPTTSSDVVWLACNDVNVQRNDYGKRFQIVVAADSLPPAVSCPEAVIAVKNGVSGGTGGELVYWVSGAEAGCPLSGSLLNDLYDGEYTVGVDYSQAELEDFIKNGIFAFHNVDGEVRVLDDINNLHTFTDTKNEEFASNQTIRVIDALCMEEAAAFNKNYLGTVQNNAEGRDLLWNRFNTIKQRFVDLGALEPFNSDALIVERGEEKGSVVITDEIEVTAAMKKLYVTTYLI